MRNSGQSALYLSVIFIAVCSAWEAKAEVGLKCTSLTPSFLDVHFKNKFSLRKSFPNNLPLWRAQGNVNDFPQDKIVFWQSKIGLAARDVPIISQEKLAPGKTIARPFPGLAHADTLAPKKSKKAKNPTGAMVRSILFPGWGQLYNGKWFKALIVFGAEAGFIGMAVYYNQKAHDDQLSALEREFYADQRNTNYWRTGVAILISMLDAYVDAHLSDFDESPDLSMHAAPRPVFRFSYKIKF